MGLIFGIIKRLIKLSLLFFVFAAVIVLIPNLPPYTNFTSIKVEPTQQRVGPLKPNTVLNNAEKMYKGKLLGPETFQVYNGELYTSLATGEIVKVSSAGHVTFVTKIGQPCTGLSQEHICGRPLGFEIDEKNKALYVADPYYGIWKVDLKTDKKQLLVSPRVEIDGRQPKIFNALKLDMNGNIYWTDSSSDFQLKDGAFSLLADPSGRLLYYNAARNESKVLLDDLWFANSLAISPDHQFIVVSESNKYRLVKYYIDGPKKGKSEVFMAGLPGIPDNLRALPDGSGVLVALYNVFDDEQPLLAKSMAETPYVRKFLARLQRLIEIPFEFLHSVYPHFLFEDIVHYIGHFSSVSGLMSEATGILQVDWNGNVIAAYYNTDGSLHHISDAIVFNDKLFTGTPNKQDYIGSVPAPLSLKKAFSTPKKAEPVKTETPKIREESKSPQTKPVQPQVKEQPKEIKKEAPKVAKPAAAEPPKQAKPIEPIKSTTQKPAVNKATTQPPTKPTEPPKQSESKPTTPKPTTKTPASVKQENKPTAPKPASPQATDTKPKTEKPKTEAKQQKPSNEKPKQIPIEEQIPSDTVKPNKETLKVIKKGGPTEIPNPNQL